MSDMWRGARRLNYGIERVRGIKYLTQEEPVDEYCK